MDKEWAIAEEDDPRVVMATLFFNPRVTKEGSECVPEEYAWLIPDKIVRDLKARAFKGWVKPPEPSEELQHEFLDAAKDPDFPLVKKMLADNRLLLNVRSAAVRWTALHQFAHVDDGDAVDFLLGLGADVNVLTSDGKTPLEVANGECIQLLGGEPPGATVAAAPYGTSMPPPPPPAKLQASTILPHERGHPSNLPKVPKPWVAYWNEEYTAYYFHNPTTDEVTWKNPEKVAKLG